jgi:hypothetical protein
VVHAGWLLLLRCLGFRVLREVRVKDLDDIMPACLPVCLPLFAARVSPYRVIPTLARMSSRRRVASLRQRQSFPEKPVKSSGCVRGTAGFAQHGYD